MNIIKIFRSAILFLAVSVAPVHAQISLMEFKMISSAFHEEFDYDLTQQNATLYINPDPSPQTPDFWWGLDDAHAAYSSYSDEHGTNHNLFLFGGYARMKGMTIDGVAMTLCHELGHGIGGLPRKEKHPSDYPASTEGQSDYYAARHCIKRFFKLIPESFPISAPSIYTEKLCLKHFKSEDDILLCHRGFQALEVEKIFLRTQLTDNSDIRYETPDKNVVQKMDLSPTFYPSAQCRLDTMVAGILHKPRPRCWWAP